MANSVIYAGEKNGYRVFKFGGLGFATPGDDLEANVYTTTMKTEKIFPAGPGGLVNFRRVAIHFLASGAYQFTVKIWIDGVRTTLGDGTVQTVTVSGTTASGEITKEIEVEGEGSHIQVELTMDSDEMTGVFLLESVMGRGRVIRQSSTRTGEVT